MSILRCTAILALALQSLDVLAAVTATVVDIPTRGITVRILHLRPDAPVGNALMFAGGEGSVGIQNDGTMASHLANCSPFIRNRLAVAGHGYSIAIVDKATDNALYRYEDMLEVIRYMQSRDPLPTWVLGGSTPAFSAVELLARAPLGNGLGAMFYAPEEFEADLAALIRAPTLIVYHPLDPRNRGSLLATAMTSAPVKQLVALTGGSNSSCAGYHTLTGLDGPFLATVFGFFDQYNPTLVYTALAESVLAVEFYNASLDHYFLTHIAGEIALLDAGVAIKGWARTGQSFKVFPSARTGSSPVCRYYIPPGKGDSHFYGRGLVECNATGAANPTFVNEDPQFFHVALPAAGVCPAGMRNVHRVFSNRADANHRYMVDEAIRDQMTAKGWLAEGDGPQLVVMCAPA